MLLRWRQKGASLLTQASLAFGEASSGHAGKKYAENGGPLTDNVVSQRSADLHSDQRVFVLKRKAGLRYEIPCSCITG
ncbi:MAG TPA: hypothetical protein DIT26_03795 [Mesotoga infera]|uniref:Uncharacterized protein n=1 Tax=Mesotoga infera TaxID=1236046 RepID=A0A3D3TKM5_9BACT|nr:hypothetical protein [Mesotoga infera]